MEDQSLFMLMTERLRFETWKREDKDLLFELHAAPRVQISYAPGPNKWTIQAIELRLTGYMEEQANFGFTKWKLCLSDGTFIGRAGWSPWGEATLEIGYAIKPILEQRIRKRGCECLTCLGASAPSTRHPCRVRAVK